MCDFIWLCDLGYSARWLVDLRVFVAGLSVGWLLYCVLIPLMSR